MASAAGHNDRKSVTGYWIKDAVTGEILQDGFFHTSCSQPLNLGDQIGALQVFVLDTTHGGTAALGAEVEYSYKVTNPNDDDAEYVVVEDDKLGIIASDEIIPAGESVTFMTTAFIEEATTNVATVNGEVGGVMCEEAASEVTITLTDPPDSPTICTEKISTTSNG